MTGSLTLIIVIVVIVLAVLAMGLKRHARF